MPESSIKDHRTQPLVGFLAVSLSVTAIWIALTSFEFVAFDLYPVREEPADFSPYFLARSLLAFVFSAALVGVLFHGGRESLRDSKGLVAGERHLAVMVMATALLCTGIFLVSPELFRDMADEDTFIEWASAGLLFFASGCFVWEALRRLRERRGRDDWTGWTELFVSVGFAVLFFLIAMEEISWMQRIVGFETPDTMEQINWQGEFNLHNIHTDLSETAYYTGAGIFLFLFPLLRETARTGLKVVDRLLDFAPGRSVAAAAAPAAMFNYGHWNLIPVQVTTFVALLVLLVYAEAAPDRSDRSEAVLFVSLAGALIVGQIVFLALGDRMIEIPNATEFKELFISLGLAWYALERVARKRYQPASARSPA